MTKHSLYVTFDGLSDPLGQSQILPYLIGIAKNGYSITILSCEKPNRLQQQKETITKQLEHLPIQWQYLNYDESGGAFSRFKYCRQLYQLAKKDLKKNKPGLIHCRSYLAALVGQRLKRKFKLPFVFDMRGFWADERREGNIWSDQRPLHRLLYSYFKRKEKAFLKDADHVVSLTAAGLKSLNELYPNLNLDKKTTIIPCCTDTSRFDPDTVKAIVPNGLASADQLLVYTGSIGTWYYTREMIDCVLLWRKKMPQLKLLILTKDLEQLNEILKLYPETDKSMIFTASAEHREVPGYLKTASAAIFFIKPVYSKIASSPTKMAECWSMDLPVITNSGIGDNDLFFQNNRGGVLVENFNASAYENAFEKYTVLNKSPGIYRAVALQDFDNNTAIAKYTAIYSSVWNNAVH